MMFRFACIGALVTAVTAPLDLRANLLINGSFETPVVPASGTYFQNTASLTGWTIAGGSVDIVRAHASLPTNLPVPPLGNIATNLANAATNLLVPAGSASNGLQYLDLNGGLSLTTGATLSQTFATSVGAHYALTFDYADNYIRTSTASGQVLINGSPVTSLTHTTSAANNLNWNSYTALFTATSASTTIAFQSTNSGVGGLILDNAAVEVVPVPTTAGLLVVGLGMAGFVVRRRRAIVSAA